MHCGAAVVNRSAFRLRTTLRRAVGYRFGGFLKVMPPALTLNAMRPAVVPVSKLLF